VYLRSYFRTSVLPHLRRYFRTFVRKYESTFVLRTEVWYESTFESTYFRKYESTFVLSYKIYQKIDMIPLCTCTLYESRTFESTRSPTTSVLSKVSFTFVLSKYFRTKILSYFRTEIDTKVLSYESTKVLPCVALQRCTFEGSSTRTSFRRCTRTAVHVYCTVYSTTLFQPITSGKCSDTVQRVAVPNPAPCPLSKKSSKGRTTISQPRCA